MNSILLYTEVDSVLFSKWEELWREIGDSFFNSPYWYKAATNAFHCQNIHIYAYYTDDKLKGIIALHEEKLFNRTVLRFVGKRFYEQGCILVENDIVLIELIQEITKNGTPLYVDEIRYNLKADFQIKKECSVCPAINLEQWPYTMKSRKKYRQRNNKYLKNRNELVIKEYTGDEALKVLTVVYNLERNSKKISQKKSIFTDDKVCKLYEEIAQIGEFFNIAILEFNNTPISAIIYFITDCKKSIVADCYTTYDSKYSSWSPGNILLQQIIERNAEKGMKLYDLSRGITTQKLEYTQFGIQQYEYLFCKKTTDKIYFKSVYKIKELFLHLKFIIKRILRKKTIYLKNGFFTSE